MKQLRGWIIYSWVALPTVMYGGYALLQLVSRQQDAARIVWFRAGHAHAGVLLLMSLLFYYFLGNTDLSPRTKHSVCAVLVLGILCQSGGFFVRMLMGEARGALIGTAITTSGALLLSGAIAVLVYGIATTRYPAAPA